MRDAKEPDEDRLARWVAQHGVALKGFLRASLRQPDLADDLAQESLCRAWAARHRYVERGKERGYLLRIADRLARDANRRPRLLELPDIAAPCGKTDADLESRETAAELQAALATLTAPQRRTLLLRYYGDMGFSEIATAMGCPLNTVLSHARRGLLTLRSLLVGETV